MYDLPSFLNGLDIIYKSGDINQVEAYLRSGLEQAMAKKDDGAVFTILNEMMGYYRGASRYRECEACITAAFRLADAMGIAGTLNYGTLLINAATGYRAAGNYQQAEKLYKEASRIFSDNMPAHDYRMASLHNNLSLLYGETGRFKEAKDELLSAMEIIRHVDGAQVEIAITHANLGNICFQMRDIDSGTEHMKTAVRIFEETADRKDSHYASALAGLGEAYYHAGNLDESIQYYEKALKEIEQAYGHNDYYRITNENLGKVKDFQNRMLIFQQQKKNGLEISRAYFETYGKPLIQTRYPEYADRIAVGLVGEGSECLGFDDIYSTDHDYGPGFCLWLEKTDYEKIGKALMEDYQKLPGEFMGFPVRNSTSHGKNRVGVFEIGTFYRQLTGYSHVPTSESQWWDISQEALRTATNGQVFEDPLGIFTKIRHGFLAYPQTVGLKKLALALGKTAQAGQYNFRRAKVRGDKGAMYLSLTEFISGALETAYLLNHIYMPFYKWRMRGTEAFTCLTDLKTCLEEIMDLEIHDSLMESRIESICITIVQELNRQGITASQESFLENQKNEIMAALDLIGDIITAEWNQFQNVHNEGGRALCQDDYETFEIMRKSQFLTWDRQLLESYLDDLKRADQEHWNLIMEKYARMMESTAPSQFAEFAHVLPRRGEDRIRLQEEIILKEMRWSEDFIRRYPKLGAKGRSLHTIQDTTWDTSVETYLRGELSTYSDRTLELYSRMTDRLQSEGKNLKEMNISNMINFYGYDSLETAEKAHK